MKKNKYDTIYSKSIRKVGWGHKTVTKLYIYHPINLHGGDFRFINLRVNQCHMVMH